jgi:choline dehydrogenase-like flavoprotein
LIAEVVGHVWDVIIIGAGMGGGMIGRRLAEQNLSVLFIDSGLAGRRDDEREWCSIEDPMERRERGYWPAPMKATIGGRSSTFYGPVGSGPGGTSLFYAATLERPERHDLEDSHEIPHPTGGWPVGYDDFQAYYEAAEALLHVCGEADPLSRETAPRLQVAPPLSEGDAAMVEAFRREGLHPYRKHVGVRYLPECPECFGRKCPLKCKMDGRSAGVEPALATGNAVLLDGTDVVALRGSGQNISHVEAMRDGQVFSLTARRYVLAAGALGSPRLLLASASEHWPAGCANESGLVGRNLMFKLCERLAIWPEDPADFNGPVNTISLRDFYCKDGTRFGHLQSMGLEASYGDIVQYLNGKFDQRAPRFLRPLREMTRVPAFLASKVFGNARIFQGLLEDMPLEENRVFLDPDDRMTIRFEYSFSDELLARRKAFRALLKQGLGRQRSMFLDVSPELSLSHSCGTLRFGTDPGTSVLNASCRAHSVENLYVADSSFMPTCTGINPSLTIAANALRVADCLIAELDDFVTHSDKVA